jgi:hypothetical protein
VGVAGPDDSAVIARATRALRHGAREAGLLGAGEDPLEIEDLGPVDEARLDRLGTATVRCDLLVWTLPVVSPFSLRNLYLMGVFRWATGATAMSCLLQGGVGAGLPVDEGLGRARAAGIWQAPTDLVRWDGGPGHLIGVLQAAMARADAARRARAREASADPTGRAVSTRNVEG